jgi:GTP-binding protein
VLASAFEQSASKVEQCPEADLPEVAVAGRSNVGKSSLLNALCNRRGLARVSRTPGRTQLLNFFALTLRGPEHDKLPMRFCDLPGYGFAAGGRSLREGFAPMIEGYLEKRDNLRGLVLLVDLRRGVGELDRGMMSFLAARGLPTLLVATKADKLGASARGAARRKIAKSVGVDRRDVLLTSTLSGMGLHGRDGLAADLASLILQPDPGAEDAPPATTDDGDHDEG